MEAGQKGKIAADGKITREIWDVNEFAWYTGTLSFENKSMKEVAKILSKLSEKPVVVSDKIAECKLSLKIDYERIEEVFDVIAETLDISWNENLKRYILMEKAVKLVIFLLFVPLLSLCQEVETFADLIARLEGETDYNFSYPESIKGIQVKIEDVDITRLEILSGLLESSGIRLIHRR